MRILFISEYFHGRPETEVGGVYQRMQILIDAAGALGELDMLFFVNSHIDTSPESTAQWQRTLSRRWGADLTLFLCRRLNTFHPRIRFHEWARLHARLLARGAYNISIDGFGVGTSGDIQVRALETCLLRRPDLILAHRLGAIAPLLLTGNDLPPVLFDLDDVEHIKYERFTKDRESRRLGIKVLLNRRLILLSEYRAIRLATRTFVCSNRDRTAILRRWPKLGVVTVPNAVPSRALTPIPDALTVLFIGDFGYEPNAQAASVLIAEIWPIVSRSMPAARLLIAGRSAERIPAFRSAGSGVEFLGFVNDLDALYQRTRVVACPIRVGSGTRVKILEAAAYAKPVVATSIAAEGLELENDREILLRESTVAFADACLHLLADKRKCQQLGKRAWASVTQRYNRDNVVADVSKSMLEAVRNPTRER